MERLKLFRVFSAVIVCVCMRIWCFSCFGGGEGNRGNCEEREFFCDKMSEGIWGNVLEGDRDAMENEEFEGFELEFAAWDGSVEVGEEQRVLGVGSESQAGGLSRDAVQNEGLLNVNGSGTGGEIDVKVGNSRCFDQFESSSGEGMKEVNLHLGLGDEPSSSSSTALLSSAVDRNGCDRDSHNKRPKVQSFTL